MAAERAERVNGCIAEAKQQRLKKGNQ